MAYNGEPTEEELRKLAQTPFYLELQQIIETLPENKRPCFIEWIVATAKLFADMAAIDAEAGE